MTKKFREYLQRVEVQLRCKDMSDYRADDRRLFLYCRLFTVDANQKAGLTCLQTAEMLNVSYLRDLAKGETWWRS